MRWKDRVGAFQMDATEADIYLVSRFDRSVVVGRPSIYMAVDTATQLVAGNFVRFPVFMFPDDIPDQAPLPFLPSWLFLLLIP